MLELFQTPWSEITQKMPEIAEAGYDSLVAAEPGQGQQRLVLGRLRPV